jgi:hypothetical protein
MTSAKGELMQPAPPLDLRVVKERIRHMDQMKLFKDNMKFLDRLRNSKGTLDMSEFSKFERQHKAYKKNLTESTNLIQNLHLKDNLAGRSISVSKAGHITNNLPNNGDSSNKGGHGFI